MPTNAPERPVRGLSEPVSGPIASGFGPRSRPVTRGGHRGSANHGGIDFAVPSGTPVFSADAGEVVFAGPKGGYGNYVRLRHPDGTESGYAHLSEIDVKVGQRVGGRTRLALSGATGNVSGPHLHFEFFDRDGPNLYAIDPSARFAGAPRTDPGTRHPVREANPDIQHPLEGQDITVGGETRTISRVYESDGRVQPGDVWDPSRNAYIREVGGTYEPPAPLAPDYDRRATERESQALDRQDQQVIEASLVPEGVIDDIGKGLFIEGGQAAISGAKRGVNEVMNGVDAIADQIERFVPGTVEWQGFDGDPNTPMSVRLTTQNQAAQDMEAAGKKPGFVQSLFSGQARLPTNEGERPTTVTGKFIEGAAQFAVGWETGGRILRGWGAAGKLAKWGKTLAQGAIADFSAFDGNQQRLSNLVAQYAPDAAAPLFNYLAADEDDPELLGRFKAAVEGAGLGVALDALVGGARALRAKRVLRDEAARNMAEQGYQLPPEMPEEVAARQAETMDGEMREALGTPTGPRLKLKPADVAAGEIAGASTSPNLFDINLSRIEAPEDVQAVITTMADKFAKDVDLARRATRSWEQTREAAGGVDWVGSMAARRPGGAVNAETALAYREALNASATRLLAAAQKVVEAPSLGAQLAFRKAASAHNAIQLELMGARAEAGRALNAFKIPAGTPASTMRMVDDLLADSGGANAAQELARKVLQAGRKGDKTLQEMVRNGALGRTKEIIKLVYTNSLLSGTGTSLVNASGNLIMLGLNIAKRAVAPRLARAFGGQGSTQIGEASALIAGYQQALKDAFRLNPIEAAREIAANGGEALRRDGVFRGMAPGLDAAAPKGINLRAEREEAGALGGAAQRPLAAAAWRVSEDSPLGRGLDILQMLVESPSNVNALTDDFFKVLAARGELSAQAFRQVAREGLEGEAAHGRYHDLLDSPTEDALKAAEQEMHDLTFTRETPGMAKAFSDLRRFMDNNPTPVPFGTIVMPFLRTPANLISMAMRYSPLAPFSRRARDMLAAGGAQAEQAKAEMAVGTALWSVWMGMAMDGQITGNGPGDPAQKQALMRTDDQGGQAWQPYSVRFGDRWYSFERADPLGTGLSLVGDMAELMNNNDWASAGDETPDEITAHAITAIGAAFFDKTALRSAMEYTSALTSGKTSEAEQLIMNRAAGALPGSSALRMLRRGDDDYMRETWDVLSALRNTIPGLSADLPMQRDLWGKPRRYQSGLGTVYDAITPVQTRQSGGSAIDLEILNNGTTVTMPQRSISFDGQRISLKNRPDIYSEMVRLAGEPAFAQLNDVAEGRGPDAEFYQGLSDGPDGGKSEYIRNVIKSYREDAAAVVADKYRADLERMAADRERRRIAARDGAVGQ